ncbi:MAG: VOC family protein [Breznakibacter sp.]
MKIEHFALNVAMPVEMAGWYVRNLGMKIMFSQKEAPFTHFIADDGENMMIEIYNNPVDNVPDYASMDPLICHIAFVSDNPISDKERLEKVGATFVTKVSPNEGTVLVMMRDPWGLPIQLCKRANPMLKIQR